MEDCFFDSVVRGHHVFKRVWTPSIGEVLSDNEHDVFAVSVEKAGMIVGHVPHEVSRIIPSVSGMVGL